MLPDNNPNWVKATPKLGPSLEWAKGLVDIQQKLVWDSKIQIVERAFGNHLTLVIISSGVCCTIKIRIWQNLSSS